MKKSSSIQILKLRSDKISPVMIVAVLILSGGLLFSFVMKKDPVKKLPKAFQKDFAFIPAGQTIVNKLKADSLYILAPHKFSRISSSSYYDTTECEAFYISKYEVSNLTYKEFLMDLSNENMSEKYQESIYDSVGWSRLGSYNDPFVEMYHWHPAYYSYPAVNISLEGAEIYCEWLEKKLNESDSEYTYEVRLPKRKEWIRAARGDNHFDVYAWGGPMVRNKHGEPMCNMTHLGAEQIYYDEEKGEYGVIENPSAINPYASYSVHHNGYADPNDSGPSNDFGIYNLNGNVSEMTSDGMVCGGSFLDTGFDVRNESYKFYEGSKPFQGFRPIIKIKENKTY